MRPGTDGCRVIVGGFIGLLPAGGVVWDYVQYPAGLADMGHDVFYVEDTRLWPVYGREGANSADCSENVEHLSRVMNAFGLRDRWAYRDEASGRCYGMSEARLMDVCKSADVFLNVSCSTWMRDEYRTIPVRAMIDTDPMFTQIQLATDASFTPGDPGLRQLAEAHTRLFTFGENVGAPDCRMPISGYRWIPTRQPVLLDRWTPAGRPARGASFTTVMNWSAADDLRYQGESWGQKNREFEKFFDLPSFVPEIGLSVSVGSTTGTPFPRDRAVSAGWGVEEAAQSVPDWRSYRDYIGGSRGEFSIAKETYVKARTGWFSCRSACYLAASRPVIAQDTGWSRFVPTGEGLFAFDEPAEAVEALRSIAADPLRNEQAARWIAESCFDHRVVLSDLLEAC